MKITPVEANYKKVSQEPKKSFEMFEKQILKMIDSKQEVDTKSFSTDLYHYGFIYGKQSKGRVMNQNSMRFAEELVHKKEYNLAGIIYSTLLKFNEGDPEMVEELSVRALKIAKRKNDIVHIMARARNLNDIYQQYAYGKQGHLKTLYEEKRALSQILKNYEKAKQNYHTTSREIKPIENYQARLCTVVLHIAKLLKRNKPQQALLEINLAEKLTEGNYYEKLTEDMSAIKKQIQSNLTLAAKRKLFK